MEQALTQANQPPARLQLALNVADLNASVSYYEQLFDVKVAKRKPGYANFEIEHPPLKLVLFESHDPSDRLNHLGVEVTDEAQVEAAAAKQRARGLEVSLTEDEGCCYALQNKAVSHAPDGTMWEWYVKTEDLTHFSSDAAPTPPVCCGV